MIKKLTLIFVFSFTFTICLACQKCYELKEGQYAIDSRCNTDVSCDIPNMHNSVRFKRNNIKENDKNKKIYTYNSGDNRNCSNEIYELKEGQYEYGYYSINHSCDYGDIALVSSPNTYDTIKRTNLKNTKQDKEFYNYNAWDNRDSIYNNICDPIIDLSEEMKYDDMEMLAQLVHAEAGNQDLVGKRLVADCVLNRIDSEKFVGQNTLYDVLYADNQFSTMTSGSFEEAGWHMEETDYKAVEMEWERENRLDQNVVYFNGVYENGVNPFKHGDHWFSY